MAPEADRRTLLRRVTFDLTGELSSILRMDGEGPLQLAAPAEGSDPATAGLRAQLALAEASAVEVTEEAKQALHLHLARTSEQAQQGHEQLGRRASMAHAAGTARLPRRPATGRTSSPAAHHFFQQPATAPVPSSTKGTGTEVKFPDASCEF